MSLMFDMRALIAQWRDDPTGTYRSWFLWDERLKNSHPGETPVFYGDDPVEGESSTTSL
jgi:hypothetical protein